MKGQALYVGEVGGGISVSQIPILNSEIKQGILVSPCLYYIYCILKFFTTQVPVAICIKILCEVSHITVLQ